MKSAEHFKLGDSQGALLSKIRFEAHNGPDQLPHPLQLALWGPEGPCQGTAIKDLKVP